MLHALSADWPTARAEQKKHRIARMRVGLPVAVRLRLVEAGRTCH